MITGTTNNAILKTGQPLLLTRNKSELWHEYGHLACNQLLDTKQEDAEADEFNASTWALREIRKRGKGSWTTLEASIIHLSLLNCEQTDDLPTDHWKGHRKFLKENGFEQLRKLPIEVVTVKLIKTAIQRIRLS